MVFELSGSKYFLLTVFQLRFKSLAAVFTGNTPFFAQFSKLWMINLPSDRIGKLFCIHITECLKHFAVPDL